MASGIMGCVSNRVKIVTWLNIGVQGMLPLMSGSIPLVVHANDFHGNHEIPSIQTQAYTLKNGESIVTLANKFNLTTEQLRQINQFRTFSHGFYTLQEGDELDLPVAPLSENEKYLLRASISEESATQQQVASIASQAGAILSNQPDGHAAATMATGAASQAASAEVSDWLNKFGTAKVNLNLDSDFSAEGTSVDFLHPWYDQNNHLFFSQLGYRHKNGRNTINIGAGYRITYNDWIFGVNSFYDDDLTGHNKRIGFGLEAWANYLHLSANNYIGLTDWHQSRDFDDYDEQPANGFDIRAEGWLPVYPQLGGKLMYEQYFGDEVALFGKDERQKNPKALTVGLNYTPISLLTIGVDHRLGESGHNDTQFNLDFNYRFGVPLAEQVSSDKVVDSRNIAVSRYDLVDRNNDIVLEYKKQELIRLLLPDTLSGKSGEVMRLSGTVTSKYDINDTSWDYSEIIAAKGNAKIVGNGVHPQLDITLPPYNPLGTNIYYIRATSADTKGNKSSLVETRIQVSKPDDIISSVKLTVAEDNAIADGVDSNAVEASVFDESNNPVSGATVTFSANNGATVTSASVTTDANGKARTQLTNTTTGTTTVTANVNGVNKTADVNFNAGPATEGSLAITANDAMADGVATNEVEATIADAKGNPISGAAVTFSANNGATVTSASVTTDANGKARTQLTNTTAGTTTVTASFNGVNKTVDVNFNLDATIKSLTATDNGAMADGVATNEVEATITDAKGNPVSGATVTFSANNGATVTSASVTTDANGKARTQLTNTAAGTTTVTANVNGVNKTVDVNFIVDLSTAIKTVTLNDSVQTKVANGIDKFTFTVFVADNANHPVEGVDVAGRLMGELTPGTTIAYPEGQMSNADGKVIFTVSSTSVMKDVGVYAQPIDAGFEQGAVVADKSISFTAP